MTRQWAEDLAKAGLTDANWSDLLDAFNASWPGGPGDAPQLHHLCAFVREETGRHYTAPPIKDHPLLNKRTHQVAGECIARMRDKLAGKEGT
jgi:hypothetical protein